MSKGMNNFKKGYGVAKNVYAQAAPIAQPMLNAYAPQAAANLNQGMNMFGQAQTQMGGWGAFDQMNNQIGAFGAQH